MTVPAYDLPSITQRKKWPFGACYMKSVVLYPQSAVQAA